MDSYEHEHMLTELTRLTEQNAALQAAGDGLANALESLAAYIMYSEQKEIVSKLLTAWTQAKEMR